MLGIPGVRPVGHCPLKPSGEGGFGEELAGGTDGRTQRLGESRGLLCGRKRRGGFCLAASFCIGGKNLRDQVGTLGAQYLQQFGAACIRCHRRVPQGGGNHQLGNATGEHAQRQGELAQPVLTQGTAHAHLREGVRHEGEHGNTRRRREHRRVVAAGQRERRRPVHGDALVGVQNRQQGRRGGGAELLSDALMHLNIAAFGVLRVAKMAQEHGDVAVLAPHVIEQMRNLLRLLFGALVDGHAHVAFGQLIQCLTCGNAFRIVQGARRGSRQVVGGIVHAQARINTPLTAPGEGRMFAHRHRTGGAQHTLQNLRVLGAEHRAQGLAGHVHGHARILGGTHRGGAFVEQPAVAGIEVAAAGDHDRVHGCDSVREFHHALNGLRQGM